MLLDRQRLCFTVLVSLFAAISAPDIIIYALSGICVAVACVPFTPRSETLNSLIAPFCGTNVITVVQRARSSVLDTWFLHSPALGNEQFFAIMISGLQRPCNLTFPQKLAFLLFSCSIHDIFFTSLALLAVICTTKP